MGRDRQCPQGNSDANSRNTNRQNEPFGKMPAISMAQVYLIGAEIGEGPPAKAAVMNYFGGGNGENDQDDPKQSPHE